MIRLRELREERHWNRREAADFLGKPYTTYVNHENGFREPNSEDLIAYAKAYGVSVDYLVGRTDSKAHIGAEHLFNHERSKTAKNTEKALRNQFLRKWSQLFPNHESHDCRHTFRSQLDRQEANRACINLIMGHKGSDVGERVYTHKTVQELISTIDLLDFSV